MFDGRNKTLRNTTCAFDYGPVFEDVYYEFESQQDNVPINIDISVKELGTLPKTVYSPKVRAITERVIDAFKDKESSSLIDITHAFGGPWYKAYERGSNNIIDDDTIIEYNDKVLSELYG